MSFKFEKLQVWQSALNLSDEIDVLTKRFPKSEIFILTSQIKRAADSTTLNIAEGSTGQSNAEYKRFLSIAIRSNIEVVACLHLAKRRGIINPEDFSSLYGRCQELNGKLFALKKALN
jgi:four helix bundle protein